MSGFARSGSNAHRGRSERYYRQPNLLDVIYLVPRKNVRHGGIDDLMAELARENLTRIQGRDA